MSITHEAPIAVDVEIICPTSCIAVYSFSKETGILNHLNGIVAEMFFPISMHIGVETSSLIKRFKFKCISSEIVFMINAQELNLTHY